ncbi:MAG: nucleotidyl transferase AbiEii/AbiGii toxin family protein [Flavobacteriaceae bacterium]|nr:nucleotidyl transferase AbiEii/AbiGii toxin family protein [Flavobacteriaceae bacterium]
MLQVKSIDENTFLLLKNLVQMDYLDGFSLAGGTSLALQLGHRVSIDLDFFTDLEFNSDQLLDQLNADFIIRNATIAKNTLNLYIDYNGQSIKVEFLRHNYPLIQHPIEEMELSFIFIARYSCHEIKRNCKQRIKKGFL